MRTGGPPRRVGGIGDVLARQGDPSDVGSRRPTARPRARHRAAPRCSNGRRPGSRRTYRRMAPRARGARCSSSPASAERGPYECDLPARPPRRLARSRRGRPAGYPDDHPFIGHGEFHDVLRAKLAAVADAGLAGSVTTCLDARHVIRLTGAPAAWTCQSTSAWRESSIKPVAGDGRTPRCRHAAAVPAQEPGRGDVDVRAGGYDLTDLLVLRRRRTTARRIRASTRTRSIGCRRRWVAGVPRRLECRRQRHLQLLRGVRGAGRPSRRTILASSEPIPPASDIRRSRRPSLTRRHRRRRGCVLIPSSPPPVGR